MLGNLTEEIDKYNTMFTIMRRAIERTKYEKSQN